MAETPVTSPIELKNIPSPAIEKPVEPVVDAVKPQEVFFAIPDVHEVQKNIPTGLPVVVEFKNVSKVYNSGTKREFKAIENINFKVEDKENIGEFISIVGPSGCGKSTLINLLAGFRGIYPPTTGEIFVREKPITGPGIDRGMIFQKYNNFPHMTILENACLGMNLNKKIFNKDKKEIVERAVNKLERVGLQDHLHKFPHQLSGGQQQRLAIARTLVTKPRIILMDEPFSALDEPTRVEMQRLIVELWHEVQATVFIITHSLTEATYLGDRVWVFTKAPGTIYKEITGIHIPVAGENPLDIQKSIKFLEQVDVVASVFDEIERQKPCPKN